MIVKVSVHDLLTCLRIVIHDLQVVELRLGVLGDVLPAVDGQCGFASRHDVPFRPFMVDIGVAFRYLAILVRVNFGAYRYILRIRNTDVFLCIDVEIHNRQLAELPLQLGNLPCFDVVAVTGADPSLLASFVIGSQCFNFPITVIMAKRFARELLFIIATLVKGVFHIAGVCAGRRYRGYTFLVVAIIIDLVAFC